MATASSRSRRPSPASSLIACGSVLMPTPSSRTCSACSNTSQSMPRACSIKAVVRPPMPPPAIMTFMRALWQAGAAAQPPGAGLVYAPAQSVTRSFRLDAGVADDFAPARGFRLDEDGGLGRRSAAGTDAELGESGHQIGVGHRFVGRGIELGDDVAGGLRRRGQGVPGVGVAADHAGFFERRNTRQRGDAVIDRDGENPRAARLVEL